MSWPLSKYISMFWTQHFPPKAELNENNLPSQAGKVFIVTGGNNGLGAELVRMLYQAGGTIYIMTRDEAKSKRVIADITSTNNKTTTTAAPTTPGTIKFIHLDLQDLTTVRPAVEAFLAQESRLDVLWNNAGVGGMDASLRTKQGIEMHYGINAVGPFLLTTLLYPTLAATVKDRPPATVRVIWTGSTMIEVGTPKGGMDLSDLDVWKAPRNQNYSSSRTGNWFLASEFHRRFGGQGVLNIVQNPGSLKTGAWRYAHFYEYGLLWPIFGDAIDGARTSLWSGLTPGMSLEDGGRYVIPWGRWHPDPRPDIVRELKAKDDGASGAAERFYEWCEGKVAPFV